MSGWFILVGYGVAIATMGWPGLLVAGAHILVLVLTLPRK